ncbi:hypothetical protein ACP275_06G095300 [Erythranthe tilingii]
MISDSTTLLMSKISPGSSKTNIWGTTKFYCEFKMKRGSGKYGVYTKRLSSYCDGLFLWSVNQTEPCLLKTKFNNTQFYQGWKESLL